jgi:DamX protein
MSTISRFIEEAKLKPQDLALYRTSKTGRDWYILAYGVYPDLPKARAAVKELPARARAESPWAKSMLVIHKALESQ